MAFKWRVEGISIFQKLSFDFEPSFVLREGITDGKGENRGSRGVRRQILKTQHEKRNENGTS